MGTEVPSPASLEQAQSNFQFVHAVPIYDGTISFEVPSPAVMRAYILCAKRQTRYKTNDGYKSIRPSYGSYRDGNNWTKTTHACGYYPIRPPEFFARGVMDAPPREPERAASPSPSLSDQAMISSKDAHQARQKARRQVQTYLERSPLLGNEKKALMKIALMFGNTPDPDVDIFLPLPNESFEAWVLRGLEFQPSAFARTLEMLPGLGTLLAWGMQ